MNRRCLLPLAAALVLSAIPAMAHAFLEKADPVAGAYLNAGPAKVELRFSEALEPSFSRVSVADADGHDMGAGPSTATASQIDLALKKLPPGLYHVTWQAVALDTHRSQGGYNFIVASGAPAASPAVVSEAWLRALPAGLPDGGYFTLRNPSAKKVTLVGASSPACGMLMLHRSETMSGMSSMSDVESVDIPPGATVKFAPGGYHMMCINPTAAIKQGGRVLVTLEFSDHSRLPVQFAVRGANGK